MSDTVSDASENTGAVFEPRPNRAERRRHAAGTKRPSKACACCQPAASNAVIDIHGSQIGGRTKS